MEISYHLEGKLENGKYLFRSNTTSEEIDEKRLWQIKDLCKEWKLELDDLIIYFIENLTIEEAERIIDKMDLCGIKEQFGITD